MTDNCVEEMFNTLSEKQKRVFCNFVVDLVQEDKKTKNVRNDILHDIRQKHSDTYMVHLAKTNPGIDMDHPVTAYFNGWQQISGLVGRCFAPKSTGSVSRLKGTEYEELAIKMAEEVSDIFFKYLTEKEKIDEKIRKGSL